MKMKYSGAKKSGFSLIELLVVSTIVIILTSIGLVSFTRANMRTRDSKRKADLQAVRQALILYKSENGCYPTGETDVSGLIEAGGPLEDYVGNEDIRDPSSGGTAADYTYAALGSCGGGAGAAGFTLTSSNMETEDAYILSNP